MSLKRDIKSCETLGKDKEMSDKKEMTDELLTAGFGNKLVGYGQPFADAINNGQPRNGDSLTEEVAPLIHELCCRVQNYKDKLPTGLLDIVSVIKKIKAACPHTFASKPGDLTGEQRLVLRDAVRVLSRTNDCRADNIKRAFPEVFEKKG